MESFIIVVAFKKAGVYFFFFFDTKPTWTQKCSGQANASIPLPKVSLVYSASGWKFGNIFVLKRDWLREFTCWINGYAIVHNYLKLMCGNSNILHAVDENQMFSVGG